MDEKDNLLKALEKVKEDNIKWKEENPTITDLHHLIDMSYFDFSEEEKSLTVFCVNKVVSSGSFPKIYMIGDWKVHYYKNCGSEQECPGYCRVIDKFDKFDITGIDEKPTTPPR